MKKMLAISMSLIMAVSLAGCSSGGGAGKSTQPPTAQELSLLHLSEPPRLGMISYAVFCLKKKKKKEKENTSREEEVTSNREMWSSR